MENIKNISTLSELLDIKPRDTISISNDIDCKWEIIPFICEIFRGTIKGNNHTISNLIISTDVWGDEQAIALFHYLSRSSISDLHFKNIRFEIDKNGYTPRIAGLCYECGASIIKNVSVDVTTTFNEDIPLIYEVNSVNMSDVAIICNGKSV